MTINTEGLRAIASECASLVKVEYARDLDFRLDSLGELDAVCEELTADGPLAGDRFNLWWQLLGAYTGEVVVRAYDGRWIEHEMASGAYAVDVNGIVGFPFAVAAKVLRGEPFKSLASFGRVFPAIGENQPRSD